MRARFLAPAWMWRRLAQAPVVLLVLATLAFVLMRLAPGGPFDREGRALAPETEAALMARYGLDKALPQQFLQFLWGAVHGDLGPSLAHPERSVTEMLGASLPASALLGLSAMALAMLLGLGAGMAGALYRGRWPDHLAMSGALFGLSLPPLVTGPLLAAGLGVALGWLPPAGWGEARHLILPALVLSLPFAARIARLTRAGLLEVLQQDFVRAAKAKGLHPMRVLVVHALPAGLIPVLGFLGPAVASILTGSVVVEQIFQVPGLGSAFVDSALDRDYTVVMGATLLYGAILVLCNLLSDLALGLCDPRVRWS